MTGKTFLYFAYCVNMLSSRMECCVGKSVKRRGLGKLNNYSLLFGDYSHVWKGTLPTIATKQDCVVWGTLWEVEECHKSKLDSLQGVKKSIYKPIKVGLASVKSKGGTFEALTYRLVNDPEEPRLMKGKPMKRFRPSKLYLDDLIAGAEEANLPPFYRRWLRSIPHNGYTGSVPPKFDDEGPDYI